MPDALTALSATLPTSLVTTTENDSVTFLEWLVGPPLQTIITIVVSAVVLTVLRWAIHRAVRSVIEGTSHVRSHARRLLLRSGIDAPADDPLTVARRVQRAETMGSVLRSSAALMVGIVAITVLANIWRWDLGPLLASAGVAGVALGFGAQTLVKDFISGLFMLIEDQYGVGDVVDLGEATGVGGVRSACGSPRCATCRAPSGTSATARCCGSATSPRAGPARSSRCWSPRTRTSRLPSSCCALRSASLADDEDVAPLLLDDPAVTAYEDLSGESVRLRTMVKTVPGKQWDGPAGAAAPDPRRLHRCRGTTGAAAPRGAGPPGRERVRRPRRAGRRRSGPEQQGLTALDPVTGLDHGEHLGRPGPAGRRPGWPARPPRRRDRSTSQTSTGWPTASRSPTRHRSRTWWSTTWTPRWTSTWRPWSATSITACGRIACTRPSHGAVDLEGAPRRHRAARPGPGPTTPRA